MRRGRANQGKTKTIRERTVNAYLPTLELVEEWKLAAREADMSLSRYIIEVVERHRMSNASGIEPAWKLEERAKALETQLEELRNRYEIMCRAFARKEEQLQQFSQALEKASKSSIDTALVRRIVGIFCLRPEEPISGSTILEKLGIGSTDDDRIAKVRQSLNLLQDTHLIESAGIAEWKWCFAKKRKGKHLLSSRRKRELRERALRQA
jgi:hypothetical protein